MPLSRVRLEVCQVTDCSAPTAKHSMRITKDGDCRAKCNDSTHFENPIHSRGSGRGSWTGSFLDRLSGRAQVGSSTDAELAERLSNQTLAKTDKSAHTNKVLKEAWKAKPRWLPQKAEQDASSSTCCKQMLRCTALVVMLVTISVVMHSDDWDAAIASVNGDQSDGSWVNALHESATHLQHVVCEDNDETVRNLTSSQSCADLVEQNRCSNTVRVHSSNDSISVPDGNSSCNDNATVFGSKNLTCSDLVQWAGGHDNCSYDLSTHAARPACVDDPHSLVMSTGYSCTTYATIHGCDAACFGERCARVMCPLTCNSCPESPTSPSWASLLPSHLPADSTIAQVCRRSCGLCDRDVQVRPDATAMPSTAHAQHRNLTVAMMCPKSCGLTPAECSNALQIVVEDAHNVSASDLFALIDIDGNGLVTRHEFEIALATNVTAVSAQAPEHWIVSDAADANKLFDKVDADGSGGITKDEMVRDIESMGDNGDSMTQEQFDRAVEEFLVLIGCILVLCCLLQCQLYCNDSALFENSSHSQSSGCRSWIGTILDRRSGQNGLRDGSSYK